jgi:hypothetical protein
MQYSTAYKRTKHVDVVGTQPTSLQQTCTAADHAHSSSSSVDTLVHLT